VPAADAKLVAQAKEQQPVTLLSSRPPLLGGAGAR
jgi:hypothetical protein